VGGEGERRETASTKVVPYFDLSLEIITSWTTVPVPVTTLFLLKFDQTTELPWGRYLSPWGLFNFQKKIMILNKPRGLNTGL
jgi:hypothetical protein